ncbi:jg6011 [Pararge aegeria aegeria]|uniref:Jg6011 protein n=6 Tax=Pararge aegeria TaxID=116150 RepID=A0A8S4S8X9_9NEOP|nr:jg6011 [Pararge aegeria aegeria]
MNLHYSNHICYACGDTFLSTSRLEKHLLVHKTGCFPCKMCDKVFSLEKYVSKHYSLVHEPKCTTKCLYCPEKFIGPLQRHAHVCEKHADKVKTYTCELCGKVFTWRAYFLAHMRKRHHGEKKYKCQFCPKMFLMQYELKSHLVTHTRERKFVCGECGESFSRMQALKKHILDNHENNH